MNYCPHCGYKLAIEDTDKVGGNLPSSSVPTYEELKTQFDWVDDNYKTAVFTDTVQVVPGYFKLFHPIKHLSSEDVVHEMEKEGLRPATAGELFVWVKNNEEEQRKYPIIALGSETVVNGLRRVAGLWGNADYRDASPLVRRRVGRRLSFPRGPQPVLGYLVLLVLGNLNPWNYDHQRTYR